MIIYKATNIINNKVYIGQTMRSLSQRACGSAGIGYRHSFHFYAAIQKYGKVVVKEKNIVKGTFINIYAYDKSLYRNILVSSVQIY